MKFCPICGRPLKENGECVCGYKEEVQEEKEEEQQEITTDEMLKTLEKLGFVEKDIDNE